MKSSTTWLLWTCEIQNVRHSKTGSNLTAQYENSVKQSNGKNSEISPLLRIHQEISATNMKKKNQATGRASVT
jgi:hypothetical protein